MHSPERQCHSLLVIAVPRMSTGFDEPISRVQQNKRVLMLKVCGKVSGRGPIIYLFVLCMDMFEYVSIVQYFLNIFEEITRKWRLCANSHSLWMNICKSRLEHHIGCHWIWIIMHHFVELMHCFFVSVSFSSAFPYKLHFKLITYTHRQALLHR